MMVSSSSLGMSNTASCDSPLIASTSNNKESNRNDGTSVDYDVAIIGAGPAGLILGHALIQRGYSIRIMERRSSFRPVGSAVFLHPFALNSVRSISPKVEKQVIDAATQVGAMSMRSITNSENVFVADKFDDSTEKLGAPFITIKFWDMLQALRKGLPDDVFFFGQDAQSFERLYSDDKNNKGNIKNDNDCSSRGIRLYYDDIISNEMGCNCTVGMVIDAGGIKSNIRRQLVPDKPSIPRCRAYMTVLHVGGDSNNANIDMDIESPMISRELGFQQGGMVAMTLARMNDNEVWWTYTDREENINKPAKNREQLIEKLKVDGFPSFVSKLVEATDPKDIIVSTVAEFPVTWNWGEGNVTLLGDAAHAQLPALGLGCSTAFGDVEELCRQIDKFGLTPQALRWYETIRKPQTAALQLFSRMSYFSAGKIGEQE